MNSSSARSSDARTASGSNGSLPQKPIANATGAAGYAAAADILGDRQQVKHTSAMAGEVLRDPLLLQQLTDRVYDLLLEDLRQQRERTHNYGGFLS